MVVIARLPERPVCRSFVLKARLLFEEFDETSKIGVGRFPLDQQMQMIRHEAISPEGKIMLDCLLSQCFFQMPNQLRVHKNRKLSVSAQCNKITMAAIVIEGFEPWALSGFFHEDPS